MVLLPSCSAKESKQAHQQRLLMGQWGTPTGMVGMLYTPLQGSPSLPVLTQVTPTGTSHQALSQKLFPTLPLQSPLFVCLSKTKLSPSQPFSMPSKCYSALCWTLQTSPTHKAGTNLSCSQLIQMPHTSEGTKL